MAERAGGRAAYISAPGAAQEFLVLGCQPLWMLRDCVLLHDSEDMFGATSHSSCFFIENKFYDDMRDQRALRYSECVSLPLPLPPPASSAAPHHVVRSSVISWAKDNDRYAQPGARLMVERARGPRRWRRSQDWRCTRRLTWTPSSKT